MKIDTDKYTIVGFSYGVSGVPGPFQGVWKHTYFEPSLASPIQHLRYKWDHSPDLGSNDINFEWSLVSSNGTSASVKFKVNITDWSNGWYDETERNDIIKSKSLLHYDKLPISKFSGPLPRGLSIEKYVIGIVNGESVDLVVFRSNNLEILKKYFPMTEYESWGLPEKWYSSILDALK